MELREYMSIRRAYNLVRQDIEAKRRLTFSEFAILCRLTISGRGLKTSEIAEYQGALRPTMTHRTKHLSNLGLISSVKGSVDRRNVVCTVTDEGRACVRDLCERTRSQILPGQSLSRTTADRICRYIDAMGAIPCMAGELTLLGLSMGGEEGMTISDLVNALGLLQPTVSMSVSTLVDEGVVTKSAEVPGSRFVNIRLTESGWAQVEDLRARISDVVVRRGPRTRRRQKEDGAE